MKSKSITILTVLATLSFLFISLSAAPQKKNNKALQWHQAFQQRQQRLNLALG